MMGASEGKEGVNVADLFTSSTHLNEEQKLSHESFVVFIEQTCALTHLSLVCPNWSFHAMFYLGLVGVSFPTGLLAVQRKGLCSLHFLSCIASSTVFCSKKMLEKFFEIISFEHFLRNVLLLPLG
jgi:hypothetical protein